MLKGEAKKEYQQEYMRKRRAGLTTPRMSVATKDTVRPDVRPDVQENEAKPKLAIPGLKLEGNKIIALLDPVRPSVRPQEEVIPWYNPAVHQPGDKVKMKDNFGHIRIVTVPEVDADGHAVW